MSVRLKPVMEDAVKLVSFIMTRSTNWITCQKIDSVQNSWLTHTEISQRSHGKIIVNLNLHGTAPF